MNSKENDEIQALRQHIDNRMWSSFWTLLGIGVTIAIAFAGWEIQQENRITETTGVALEARSIAQTNTTDLKEINQRIAQSGRELSSLSAEIRALRGDMNRVNNLLEELARYLRSNGK